MKEYKTIGISKDVVRVIKLCIPQTSATLGNDTMLSKAALNISNGIIYHLSYK